MKIGVSGAEGSFSEMAGETFIKDAKIEKGEIIPLITADAVLSAVNDSEVDYGIMPIENSNGGIVIEAVYAMAKYTFEVEKMFEFDVRHNLLVKSGVTASQVEVITSHDQALKQCRHYLKRTWPDADIAEYPDTAKAAKDLASGTLHESTAVIAPRRSAELYGLEILEEAIQDLKYNYTMFLVVKKG